MGFHTLTRHNWSINKIYIQTEKRPDIVAWSDSKKSILLIELTIPWKENREEALKRKKNRYETLRADCVEKGWICHVIPIEVGCRGFIGHSVISFLSKKRNHWSQFESCLKSSSDRGAICIKLDLVEREVFSMKEIHAERAFPRDYVRNGYCKRVIPSTAESKRVFFWGGGLKITNCTLKMKINVLVASAIN